MITGLVLAMALAAEAGPPAYLSCTLNEGETAQAIDLTIDERSQSVTIDQKTTGRIVSKKAVFSPSIVKVPDDEATWSIDRVTLELRREVVIGEKRWNDVGKCKLADVPLKRAF